MKRKAESDAGSSSKRLSDNVEPTSGVAPVPMKTRKVLAQIVDELATAGSPPNLMDEFETSRGGKAAARRFWKVLVRVDKALEEGALSAMTFSYNVLKSDGPILVGEVLAGMAYNFHKANPKFQSVKKYNAHQRRRMRTAMGLFSKISR